MDARKGDMFMTWHLYKKDDPNTWPKIDCPLLVYKGEGKYPKVYQWSPAERAFVDDHSVCNYNPKECYYAYVGYVPSGYKTLYPVICTCESCPEGYDDHGYCMDYDDDYTCGCKKEVAEYSIEEKRIWKEFE
jgi:hypothetical protein